MLDNYFIDHKNLSLKDFQKGALIGIGTQGEKGALIKKGRLLYWKRALNQIITEHSLFIDPKAFPFAGSPTAIILRI